jgi:hypothetical protein
LGFGATFCQEFLAQAVPDVGEGVEELTSDDVTLDEDEGTILDLGDEAAAFGDAERVTERRWDDDATLCADLDHNRALECLHVLYSDTFW